MSPRKVGRPGSLFERWPTLSRAARRSARWTRAAAAGREALAFLRVVERHGIEPSRGGILLAGGPDEALLAGLGAALERAPRGAREPGAERADDEQREERARGTGPTREPCTLVERSPELLHALDFGARSVRAALARLPFGGDCFDLVIASRPLAGCETLDDALPILSELVRVSARLIVLSHADPAHLPGRKPAALDRLALAHELAAAGAEVVDVHHAPLLVGRQAWLVAHKKARQRSRARRVRTARELLSPTPLPGLGGLRAPA